MRTFLFFLLFSVSAVGALQAQSKILTVQLTDIYMGECGDAAHRHHEPVAGRVLCILNHNVGGAIPNLAGRSSIWNSNGHSLVCDNWYSVEQEPAYQGDGLYFSPTNEPLGTNIYQVDLQALNNGQYHLRLLFNLGVEHQDNPFAGKGGHWLTHGENLIEQVVVLSPDVVNRRHFTIGSFQTSSDRCHEFWLSFRLTVQ